MTPPGIDGDRGGAAASRAEGAGHASGAESDARACGPEGDGLVGGSPATVELVDRADIEELVRYVDRLGEGGEWAEVDAVRALSRRALERGRQLWPVASRAEYLLALAAPGPWAASVLRPGAGRFALGPLPEVAASSHAWSEVGPHLPPTPEAAVFAYERVVRGDDLSGADGVAAAANVDVSGFDLPLRLQPWEPAYPVAVYRPDTAEFPLAPVAGFATVTCAGARAANDQDEVLDALTALARGWTTESNGRAEAVAVEGGVAEALGAFGLRRARLAPLSAPDALARMAWTAASGGAHGRRRGMAAGRFDAWWALAALAGMLDEWPVDPADLGRAAEELEWSAWDSGTPESGWSLRLVIHDPADGLAWAVVCADERTA